VSVAMRISEVDGAVYN